MGLVNFAVVEALNQFLQGTSLPTEDAIERLGAVLANAGDEGLSMAELMEQAQLSRGDFLRALVGATNAGVIERTGSGETAKVKLTAQGKGLY